MEIPRDARGADLIKNRYVAPQPLAPACSDRRSRIGLIEKVHPHVRFIFSKSETQKRPQRASQNAQLRSPRRAWEMEALCRRSSPKTLHRSLRAAPSAMHRQIGRIEKAHLHVRFVASMRETQKRLQRTPQKRLRRHPLLRSSSPVRSLPQLSV